MSIQNSKEYSQLSVTQKKLIENKLRNFKLSGILLTQEEQKLFKEYNVHLSELRNKYEENILDATEGWNLLITDKENNLSIDLDDEIINSICIVKDGNKLYKDAN